MGAIIISIILIGLFLIATESLNRMNKAAVAMFFGVSCWLLYIAFGSDFVISQHPVQFFSYISSHAINAMAVKDFIAHNIFTEYIFRGAQVVLYFLATMTIVEVLNNNGCFDFIGEWLRSKRPITLLWVLAIITFLLSANLDNTTTACLMLGIMHPVFQDERMRKIYGAVIILAANCGGASTVIGDLTTLTLWTDGLITPTAYSMMVMPALVVALGTTLTLISLRLPARIHLGTHIPPYRGDDTILNRWQRMIMFFVGAGGLWFIPTFHRITQLPPFLGAMCVLSLLWIVNELCNRSLLGSDQMVRKRLPLALQYVNIQNLLFFIGLTLMFGAATETGLLQKGFTWLASAGDSMAYGVGIAGGLLSGVLGNVTTLLGLTAFFEQPNLAAVANPAHFWPLLSYTTAVGGSLLATGTITGLVLMRMENVSLKWYATHVMPKVFAGWLARLAVLFVMMYFWN